MTLLLVFVLGLTGCKKNNDDVVTVPERDRAEQQLVDKDSLLGYLSTHYFNASTFDFLTINFFSGFLIIFEISSKNPKLSLVTLFLVIDIDPIFFRYQPKIGINSNSFFKMKTGELKIV